MTSLLKRVLGSFTGPSGSPATALDDDAWREALESLPWLDYLSDDSRSRLRVLCADFIAAKTFSGAAGFGIDERVRIAIAAQACLPILNLGLGAYRDFVEIIVYPDRFLVPRRHVDEAGVVHESTDELAGEAMEKGPVVLAWPDVDPSNDQRGCNVVIHEFVHKIDMLDGEPDGTPPMAYRLRQAWASEIEGAWDSFCGMLERLEERIPRHIDPESLQADAWYAQLPLDPYAATDVGEFFAVASEAFFVDPGPLAEVFPQLYRNFVGYFGVDPLAQRSPK
jgi:Mlc titration factor MtfA (ptsG expression regulator)